eukprot:gene6967-7181_t
MLSSAIASCSTWQQLANIVETCSHHLSVNHISHILTRIEQVLPEQQMSPADVTQVEQLLAWLLQRSKQLNAAAQLGPQALSATAGALARLLNAQQQHNHRRPGHLKPVRQAQAPHGQQAQQSSDHQKQEMLQEIASAAVAQRHRLSPQGNIPSGVDGSYLAGFLAREVERAASEARDGGSSGASAATLLQAVLVKYQQFLGAAHVTLLCHHLADLWQTGWAGSGEEVMECASQLFAAARPLMRTADPAALASILSSCSQLQLYSHSLATSCLSRCRQLSRRQLMGHAGGPSQCFSARQLSIVLHSLAVLGLRPSDGWLADMLQLSLLLLPAFSLNDLERLTSALVVMRVVPGTNWTAAAEQQLAQLAAAIDTEATGLDNDVERREMALRDDSLEAAVAARQVEKSQHLEDVEGAQEYLVYEGLHNQLLSILRCHGVAVIGEDAAVEGKPFSPESMEAVMRQPTPTGFREGDVVKVLRCGYSVGNCLVRPALVVVAYDE